MPRRPRVHLDGVPLHIVQRGHNRARCFFAESDYRRYLHWLGESMRQCDCALHAYVLMTNHVHLLLTPNRAEAVPKLMISLGRHYVQHVNRTYARTGTLWDSRYRSSAVQSERYLLVCQRYIELNPVRAGLVDDPAHYRWSSYQHNALARTDRLITPHEVYVSLSGGGDERCAAYRGLFDGRLDAKALDSIRLALNQGQPFGNSSFFEDVQRVTGMRCELRPRGRPSKRAIDVCKTDSDQSRFEL